MDLSLKRSNTVREYYAAYENGDRDVIENLLVPDFTFTSPYDDHISREQFFEKCWPAGSRIKNFSITELVTNDHEAFVVYEATPESGNAIHNTELIKFRDDKIEEIHVYFGDIPKTVH